MANSNNLNGSSSSPNKQNFQPKAALHCNITPNIKKKKSSRNMRQPQHHGPRLGLLPVREFGVVGELKKKNDFFRKKMRREWREKGKGDCAYAWVDRSDGLNEWDPRGEKIKGARMRERGTRVSANGSLPHRKRRKRALNVRMRSRWSYPRCVCGDHLFILRAGRAGFFARVGPIKKLLDILFKIGLIGSMPP